MQSIFDCPPVWHRAKMEGDFAARAHFTSVVAHDADHAAEVIVLFGGMGQHGLAEPALCEVEIIPPVDGDSGCVTIACRRPDARGPAPCARSHHAAAAVSGRRMLIAGGADGRGRRLNDVHVLDLDMSSGLRTWSTLNQVGTPPVALSSHSMVCLPSASGPGARSCAVVVGREGREGSVQPVQGGRSIGCSIEGCGAWSLRCAAPAAAGAAQWQRCAAPPIATARRTNGSGGTLAPRAGHTMIFTQRISQCGTDAKCAVSCAAGSDASNRTQFRGALLVWGGRKAGGIDRIDVFGDDGGNAADESKHGEDTGNTHACCVASATDTAEIELARRLHAIARTSTPSAAPPGRRYHSAIRLGRYMLVFGGQRLGFGARSERHVSPELFALDTGRGAWVALPLNIASCGASAAQCMPQQLCRAGHGFVLSPRLASCRKGFGLILIGGLAAADKISSESWLLQL